MIKISALFTEERKSKRKRVADDNEEEEEKEASGIMGTLLSKIQPHPARFLVLRKCISTSL